jgi:Rrf2 family protein
MPVVTAFYRLPEVYALRISTKGQYAIEAMLALALTQENEMVSIRQIGEQTALSDSYLEQIFSSLRKAGLIISVRGNRGGYNLARPAVEITVGEILRAAEGSLAPVRCTEKGQTCSDQDNCLTQSVWLKFDSVIKEVVDSKTLADLVAAYNSGNYGSSVDFMI